MNSPFVLINIIHNLAIYFCINECLLNKSIMYKFFHKKSTITFNWDLKNCSYNCTNYCWTSYFQIECSEHYKTFSHLYLFNTFGDFFSFVEQQYWCNATVDILVCIPAVVTGSTFPWRSLSTCNTGLLQARKCGNAVSWCRPLLITPVKSVLV